jgi:hypothetical protein
MITVASGRFRIDDPLGSNTKDDFEICVYDDVRKDYENVLLTGSNNGPEQATFSFFPHHLDE